MDVRTGSLRRLLGRLLAVVLVALSLSAVSASTSYAEEGRSSGPPAQRERAIRGVDPTLESDATISGLVYGPRGFLLDNVLVEAVSTADPMGPPVASALTYESADATHGAYQLHVPAGSYLVRFSSPPEWDRVLATQYYGGGAGTPVDIESGGTRALDDVVMQDAAGSPVSGRVLDSAGQPHEGMEVALVRSYGADGWYPVDWTWTDATGHYTFEEVKQGRAHTVLAYGDYYWFDDDDGARGADTYLGDAPTAELADSFTLPAGSAGTELADLQLHAGASVTGTVVDDAGQPVEFADIDVLIDAGDGLTVRNYGYTQEDGTFTIRGLWAGLPQTLYFYSYGELFEPIYLGGSATEAGATLFTPAAGTTHDAGETTLPSRHSKGSGTVVDEEGAPLDRADVTLLRQYDGGFWYDVDYDFTGADGDYRLRLPWGGTYTVLAQADGYADRYLGGSSTLAGAQTITVPEGQSTTTIPQIVLEQLTAGKVRGTVVDGAGDPIPSAQAELWVLDPDFGWEQWDSKETRSDGSYRFRGVPFDTQVTVAAAKPNAGFTQLFLGGSDAPESATTLTTTAAAPVADAGSLALSVPPGTLSGTVLPAAGQELDDELDVVLYELVDDGAGGTYLEYRDEVFLYPSDGDDGSFAFTGLAAGSYTVHVRPDEYYYFDDSDLPRHASTWRGGARPTGPASPGVVALGTDEIRTGVDVQLDRGVVLSGTARNQAGDPLADADIYVGEWYREFGFDQVDYLGYAYTGGDGTYRVRVPSTTELSLEAYRTNYAYFVHGGDLNEKRPDNTIPVSGTDVTFDFAMTPDWADVGTVAGVRDEACLENAGYDEDVTVGGIPLTIHGEGYITRRNDFRSYLDNPLDDSVRLPALAPYADPNGFGFTWGTRDDGTLCVLWNDEKTAQVLLAPATDGGLDVTYNYDRVDQYIEPMTASARQLGDDERVAGFTDGNGPGAGHVVFPGAGSTGGYNDTNTDTGLIHNSLNSTQTGRYSFHFDGFALRDRPPVSEGDATITGDTQPGQTLTADPGTWTIAGAPATGLEYSYTWYRGAEWRGNVVSEGATYVLTDADRDKRLHVEIQAWKAGHEPGTWTERIRIPAGPPAATNSATPVLGPDEPAIGDTVTTTQGSWSVTDGTLADVTFEVRWFRNDRRIRGAGGVFGAGGEQYVVTSADAGERLHALVVASRPDHADVKVASNEITARQAPTLAPTTAPTLGGEPKVGGTVTVDPGSWDSGGAPVSYSYRWLVGAERRSADADDPAALTLRPEDLGEYVTVVVTASADGFRDGTVQLTAGPVADGDVSLATLDGTVVGPDGPVAGASWSACEYETWTCVPGGTTGSDGTFSARGYASTTYHVTIYPADGSGLRSLEQEVALPATGTVARTFTLEPVPVPPENVTLPGANGTSWTGLPSVYYGDPQVIEVTGCPDVVDPSYTVTFAEGYDPMTGPMTVKETLPSGLVVYTATIPPFEPRHGEAEISTNIPATCGGAPTEVLIYIDPSGIVTDQYGRPLVGATVTLLRSDAPAGPFLVVPDGSEIMSPDNRTNPDTTDDTGFFRWDVTEGWYKVRAETSGCDQLTSDAMQVNPPRVDLLLKLSCTAAPPTITPQVSGTPEVGQTLTTNEEDWPEYLDVALQWQRDGADIPGATGASYVLTADDAGAVLTVEHDAARPEYVQEEGRGTPVQFTPVPTQESAGVDVVQPGPVEVETPGSIAGSGKVGTSLTATDPVWAEDGVTTTRQWLVAGQPVAGQTGATYEVRPADVGRKVRVRFTGAKAGRDDATQLSNEISGARGDAPTATAPPTITGAAKAGSTVTATSPTWDLAGVANAYQWLRDGQPVAGATAATYAVGVDDIGTALSVRVTGTKAGYADGQATSAEVSVPKAESTTKLKVKKKFKAKKPPKVTITVRADGVPAPTGKLKIYDGKKKIGKAKLVAADEGKVKVKLKRLKKGKHKLSVRYLGSALVEGSVSKVVKVKAT